MSKDRIRVRELSGREIGELDRRRGFGKLRPVECENCGFRRSFPRRLFQIEGLRDDEADRAVLGHHMKRSHGIEGYIFRPAGNRTFLEAASCPKCKSTRIIFDLVAL